MARLSTKSLLILSLVGLSLAQLCTPSTTAIFSTQINTPRSQNVVFTNAGSMAVSVSSITFQGPDAALFVATLPTLPATVNEAQTLTVPISFSPTTSGLKEAVMVLETSIGAKTFVYLEGVAAAGLGGLNEPSLQYILAANRIPVNVGDNDPSDNIIAATAAGQNVAVLGDEVKAQYFEKVNPNHPVSFDVLAAFGPTGNDPVVTLGYYNPIGSASSPMTPILSISNAPGNNGQTMNPVVSGTPSFEPLQSVFGLYTLWPYFSNRMVYSEDALNTWDSGNHHLRVYRYKNEQGVAMNDTLILAWEEDSTNKDFNDIVLIARNIKIGNSAKVLNLDVPRDAQGNLQTGWRNDLFTGFKMNTGENLFILRRHFGVPFVIENQNPNAALQITAMDLSVPADWGFYPAPVLPLTIAAGQNASFNVTFIKNGGEKNRYESFLTITTNDTQAPTQTITLEGLYMITTEDINELPLSILNDGFGFFTNMHNPDLQMTIDGRYAAALNGEEVRSRLWQAADSTKPVFARKTGAFRQCCNDSGIISLNGGDGAVLAQMVDSNLWSQTILPMAWGELSYYTEMTYTPGPNFAIVSGLGGQWTSWSTNTYGPQVGTKVWPLRDYYSEIVPNSYLIGQDFIWNGCGDGGNCDYNDNMGHINNIKPTTQDGVDQRAKDRSYYVALGDAALSLSWTRTYATFTLADSANVPTGFISVVNSGGDNNIAGGDSYKKQFLTVTGNALNVVAQAGNMIGANNGQVNALFLRFDGRDRPFTVSSNLKNLGGITGGAAQAAGIFLGQKQYFASLAYNGAGNVQFYAELNDTGSVIAETAVASAGLLNLRLMLVGDYRTNVITAMYEAYYASSLTSGVVGTYTVPDVNRGYFFGRPSEAGIWTSGNGFTVTYDDFEILSGTGCFYQNTLPTFTYGQFIPTGPATSETPSSSAAASSTSGTNSTATVTGSTPTGSTPTGTSGSGNTGIPTTPSETSPDSCGESLPTQATTEDTTQPSRATEQTVSTGQPTVNTGAGVQGTSDASIFAPLAVFLVVAIAMTM